MLKPIGGPVHVTVQRSGGRSKRTGICLHRSSSLPVADTTHHNGIPVTTPARTIADLRRVASDDEVRRAMRKAEFLRLDIGNEGGHDRTRSELEARFLRLCHRHGLPRPEVNVRVGPFLVDFLWSEHRLIVETDGYQAHRGREAFESDRARDVDLRLRGYTVVRFTYRQVIDSPAEVANALRALLSRD